MTNDPASSPRPSTVRVLSVATAGLLAAVTCVACTSSAPQKAAAGKSLGPLLADTKPSLDPSVFLYPYNGKVQSINVPRGYARAQITTVSGGGGDSNGSGGTPTAITATWRVTPTDTITMDIGSSGTKGTAGRSSGTLPSGGGNPGCKDAGGGGAATIVAINGAVIVVAGGGGGGGYYGASWLTDQGGNGGSAAGPGAAGGHGPKAGSPGAPGTGNTLGLGGNGSNGSNLGGCAGGGGGGVGGGGGGTGGSTGGGGGGGGGAGGTRVTGNADSPVISNDGGLGGNGYVKLTFTS